MISFVSDGDTLPTNGKSYDRPIISQNIPEKIGFYFTLASMPKKIKTCYCFYFYMKILMRIYILFVLFRGARETNPYYMFLVQHYSRKIHSNSL